MRALFDVNLLIALFDPDHLFHENAHRWWSENLRKGWASCSITENGMVRVMSSPKYSPSRPFSPSELIGRLQAFTEQSDHWFVSEPTSIRDRMYVAENILRSAELTDVYLLGLAVKHQLRLVTFDRGIKLHAVQGARAEHLIVL